MKERVESNVEIEDLFLRRKPARLLVFIKREGNSYASILAKKIDCTYAHTVKLLQKMEKLDLVKFNKSGRIKYVELTEKGNKLAKGFENLIFNEM